jgi:hypothetical protein
LFNFAWRKKQVWIWESSGKRRSSESQDIVITTCDFDFWQSSTYSFTLPVWMSKYRKVCRIWGDYISFVGRSPHSFSHSRFFRWNMPTNQQKSWLRSRCNHIMFHRVWHHPQC